MDRDSLIEMTPMRPGVAAEGLHSSTTTPARRDLEATTLPPPTHLPSTQPVHREDLSYVWGTSIAVELFRAEFRTFLETFEGPAEAVTTNLAEAGLSASATADHPPPSSMTATALAANARFGASTTNLSRESAAFQQRFPFFVQRMRQMQIRGETKLLVDFTLLQLYAPTLFQQTRSHPAECLQMMDGVTEEVYRGRFPDTPPDVMISAAVYNLPNLISLRELGPAFIDELVGLRGMIVRASKIIPEVRVAHFECWMCHHTERSVVERGRIFEPVRCAHCGKQYSYRLIHNQSLFEDKQLIRLQEAPEHLSDGETPVTISVVVYGQMVDDTVPGDRVTVTGIYRASPLKLNANTRIVRSVFNTHLDAIHIEKTNRAAQATGREGLQAGSQSQGLADSLDIQDRGRIDQLYELSRHPDIYGILRRSLARTIWGHEDVKRGLLAQMFGGSQKVMKHGRFRAEINIILCGDPGVAKSQMLTQVHEISPRGVYTSGKGSSSVGLTAFVVRDTDTGELVLEPGALVLSDKGLCCIDEFDKMNEATRSVLHEVMEQQTLSVAKAGIIAQLNARTSLLAAANPKESQWNPTLNIVENLQIEPTLLSRFDLIFLLLDRDDRQEDKRLASHVLSLYMEQPVPSKNNRDTEAKEELPAEGTALPPATCHATDSPLLLLGSESTGGFYMAPRILSQYIAYARENINPVLSEDAHTALAKAYVELRKVRGSGKTVSATLRQLESMIRIAEANCKMRYGTSVTPSDVADAKHLISAALKDAATDPRTGLINMDMFAAPDPNGSGGSGSGERALHRLESIIEKRYMAQGKDHATVQELRVAYQEGIPGNHHLAPTMPIQQNQLTDLLAMLAGGSHVRSFTSAVVQFAAAGATTTSGS